MLQFQEEFTCWEKVNSSVWGSLRGQKSSLTSERACILQAKEKNKLVREPTATTVLAVDLHIELNSEDK